MKKKISCLFLSKMDDVRLTNYLNKQAACGYHITYICEPFLIFEKASKTSQIHYHTLPRKSFGSLLKDDHEAMQDPYYVLSSWRFHIYQDQPDSSPISLRSHYVDSLFYLLLYGAGILYLLFHTQYFNIVHLKLDAFIPIAILSFLYIFWQITMIYIKTKSISYHQFAQRFLWIRDIIAVSIIGLWLYAASMAIHFYTSTWIFILLWYFILLLVRQFYIHPKLTINIRIIRTCLICTILIQGYLLSTLSDPSGKTCTKDSHVLTLEEFNIKKQISDCDVNGNETTYRESDNLYTAWNNDRNLKEDDKETMIRNYFYHFQDTSQAKEEYERYIQYSKEHDADKISLDNSWNIDEGFYYINNQEEVLIILHDTTLYCYYFDHGDTIHQQWMDLIKEKFA